MCLCAANTQLENKEGQFMGGALASNGDRFMVREGGREGGIKFNRFCVDTEFAKLAYFCQNITYRL